MYLTLLDDKQPPGRRPASQKSHFRDTELTLAGNI